MLTYTFIPYEYTNLKDALKLKLARREKFGETNAAAGSIPTIRIGYAPRMAFEYGSR